MEVGGGELTIYDNLDAKTGKVCWSRPVPRPAPAVHPADRRVQADALGRRVLARREKNPQLQRVYGTAWPTRDALKAYLKLLEEAARRDHRKLGADLDLFSFPDEIGSGLAVFHPKGGIIRREMENYSRRRHEEAGYSFVNTPHITKAQLFETSGHLPWYADGMFPPMEMEGAEYYLKPMNCPFHNLIFRSRGRSYRELPLRLFEFGTVYRYEKSGVVHGLTRVRGHDPGRRAHLLHPGADGRRADARCCSFVLDLLRDYGLDDFYLELSTRDDSPKFIGDAGGLGGGDRGAAAAPPRSPAWSWCPTRAARRSTARRSRVQARDAIGRTWQMSTIQVDFNLPRALRAGVPGGRRHPAAAGHDPPGAVRLDRAVLRRAHRALRRRVPGLAGAGAGGRHPDPRRPRRLPARVRRPAARPRASGPRSTPPTTGCRRRSAPRSSRRSRSW